MPRRPRRGAFDRNRYSESTECAKCRSRSAASDGQTRPTARRRRTNICVNAEPVQCGGFFAAAAAAAPRRSPSAAALTGDVIAIAPLELVVADNLRLPADEPLGAAIALRKPAAEIVHGRFGIDADRRRVVTHVRPRVDAGRPAREIVALEPLPQRDADLGRRRELFERHPSLDADAAEIGSEGVALAHDSLAHLRKNADQQSSRKRGCNLLQGSHLRISAVSGPGWPVSIFNNPDYGSGR